MSRRRQKKRNNRAAYQEEETQTYHKRTVRPRNINQKRYIDSIRDNKLTLCLGPAGTGKTYLATALALLSLKRNEDIKRIVITRPLVQAGEDTGFLPGDIKKKLEPYLKPIYDEMRHFIDIATIHRWLEDETIEIIPYAYMRGRNFNNTFIIADEGQNASKAQLKMLVTRYGAASKMVILGDHTQSDLPVGRAGSLWWLADRIIPRMMSMGSSVNIVNMSNADIVRESLVEDFINAVEDDEHEEGTSEDSGSKCGLPSYGHNFMEESDYP